MFIVPMAQILLTEVDGSTGSTGSTAFLQISIFGRLASDIGLALFESWLGRSNAAVLTDVPDVRRFTAEVQH